MNNYDLMLFGNCFFKRIGMLYGLKKLSFKSIIINRASKNYKIHQPKKLIEQYGKPTEQYSDWD